MEIAKEICIGNLHWYLHWKIAEGNLHSLLSVGNLGVRTTSEYWRSRKQKISMEEFDNTETRFKVGQIQKH